MLSLRHVIPVAVLFATCYANVQHGNVPQQKQAQQQHSHPAYIIPTVNRQSGLGGLSALSSLGSSFGGFGGLGGGGSGGGLGSLLSSFGGFSGGSMLSTALPLLMVVGLGAMLVPLLGGAFFRESQKRGLPSISPAFVDGLTDILEKFVKALDSMEKKQA